MNRYEKKKILHSYQAIIIDIERLMEEYERIYTEATKIVPTLTGMPSSNVKDDKMLKHVEKMVEIQNRIDKKKQKIAWIDSELARLKPHHREIVEYIDIKGFSTEKVAELMHTSEKAIKLRHNRTIDRMFNNQ